MQGAPAETVGLPHAVEETPLPLPGTRGRRRIYLLRHDTGEDAWELVMYDSGKRDDTRLSST